MKWLLFSVLLTSCVTAQPPKGIDCPFANSTDCQELMAQLNICITASDWSPYVMGEVPGNRFMLTFTKDPLNSVFLEVCESSEPDDDLLIRQGFTKLGSCSYDGETLHFFQREIDGVDEIDKTSHQSEGRR